MQIELAFHCEPSARSTRSWDRRDIEVDLDEFHTIGDLIRRLAADGGYDADNLALAGPTFEVFDPDEPAAACGLVNGDSVYLARRRRLPSPPALEPKTVRLATAFGPDTGRSRPLVDGSAVRVYARAHRGADGAKLRAGFQIRSVSSCEAGESGGSDGAGAYQLSVLGDRSAAVVVDGRIVTTTATVSVDSIIQIGREFWTIRRRPESQRRHRLADDETRDRFARIPFTRSADMLTGITDRPFGPLGDVPVKPEPMTFPYLAMIAPLAMAAALYSSMGPSPYLILLLMSPMIVVGSHLHQLLDARKRYRRGIERFDQELKERAVAVADALVDEWRERHTVMPDGEELGHRALSRSPNLWNRVRPQIRLDDTWFMRVRAGVGSVEPRVTVAPETGGERHLRKRAEAVAESVSSIGDVPIEFDLLAQPVLSITGDDAVEEIDGCVRALLTQVACSHSPEDLVVVAALSRSMARRHHYLRWLPHCKANSTPLEGKHLVRTRTDALALAGELLEVAASRLDDTKPSNRWPQILFVVDDQLVPDRSIFTELLEFGPGAGITVLWVGGSPPLTFAELSVSPVSTGRRSVLRWVEEGVADQPLWSESMTPRFADRVARALAALVDTSSSRGVTAIPHRVGLFETLGLVDCSSATVDARWRANAGCYSLPAPIGMGADGPVVVDLVTDGPHTLLVGTTGAGKSVALTSMIAGLMANHSPQHLNFQFIDYKGGATIERFRHAPHTVGCVTNIVKDPTLAQRAITTLEAERRDREEALSDIGDIKDLMADGGETPPLLVIVVEEFAQLAKDQPAFVSVLIEIARVGRSLGIHLIMATQSPGDIPGKILDNTVLRIALRVVDESQSMPIIGTGDAAHIPGPLKGRCYVKADGARPVPVQAAWSDMEAPELDRRKPLEAHDLGEGPSPDIEDTVDDDGRPRQINVLLEATERAAQKLGAEWATEHGSGLVPPWQRPLWLPPLPEVVDLDELTSPAAVNAALDDSVDASGDPTRYLPLGLIDEPQHRRQITATLDLAKAGGLLVCGGPGSGRTTVLETVAAAAVLIDHRHHTTPTVELFGIGTGRLTLAEKIPGYGREVAAPTDYEALSFILRNLTRRLAQREADGRRARQTGEPTGFVACPDNRRVILLVDGLDNVIEDLETLRDDELYESIQHVALNGPPFGIHLVATAARPEALRSRIPSAISGRLVLRQLDSSSYTALGVPHEETRVFVDHPEFTLTPGRGFLNGHRTMQVARWSGELPELAERLGLKPGAGDRLRRLPESITPAEVAEFGGSFGMVAPGHVTLGLADEPLEPFTLNLSETNFGLCGPRRAGKSNTLRVCLEQLAATSPCWAFVPHRSPAWNGAELDGIAVYRGDPAVGLHELLALAGQDRSTVHYAAFDDFDSNIGDELFPVLDKLITCPNIRLIGAATQLQLRPVFMGNPLFNAFVDVMVPKLYLKHRAVDDLWYEHQLSSPKPRAGLKLNLVNRGILVTDDTARVVQTSQLPTPDREIEPVPTGAVAMVAGRPGPLLTPTTSAEPEPEVVAAEPEPEPEAVEVEPELVTAEPEPEPEPGPEDVEVEREVIAPDPEPEPDDPAPAIPPQSKSRAVARWLAAVLTLLLIIGLMAAYLTQQGWFTS